MKRFEFGLRQDVPIDQRIIGQLSGLTIRDISAALVELMTNSDDSYRRLEESGFSASGKIEVRIVREKGARCANIEVRDFAEGMSREELENAVRFAGQTSGFVQGKSVRGLFGRGLKEAIFALGEGEIITIKDGILDHARLYRDNQQRFSYRLLKSPQKVTPSLRQELGIRNNGALIKITVTNPDIRVPTCRKFRPRLERHYALRDILASSNREVKLTFVDKGHKSGKAGPLETLPTLKYEPPEGDLVEDVSFQLPNYEDEVHLQIFESPTELQFGRYAPFSEAGILIKTTGAILDNQLFDYHDEAAAYYFFGWADCPGIAQRVRQGDETLIDLNRGGLRWDSEYCRVLEKELKDRLAKFVEGKEKELRGEQKRTMLISVRKKLGQLAKFLNDWADKEFAWDTAIDYDPHISHIIVDRLTIKPLIAYVRPSEPRALSIYAPVGMYDENIARVDSDNPYIKVLTPEVELEEGRNPSVIQGSFRVSGEIEGQEGIISCRLGQDEAYAKVVVQEFGKRRRRRRVMGVKRGMIRGIVPDARSNPIQRVFYQAGEIRIFLNFPGVKPYLGSHLEGVGRPEGKAILAELIAEAFCRALTRRALESGDIGFNPATPGAEIDAFNSRFNRYRRRYLGKIHEYIGAWPAEELGLSDG